MKKLIAILVLVPTLCIAAVIKKPTEKTFYVYKDATTPMHFIPAGWMGDVQDMKLNPKSEVSKGNTCIEIKYSAQRTQDNGWAGIYFQDPPSNWGSMKGGYDLSSYKKLTFKVRGEKGNEVIDKFIFGGISAATEEGDSDSAALTDITLEKEWREYSIDISKLDRSHIIGGFGFAMNADNNPAGIGFELDDIRFE